MAAVARTIKPSLATKLPSGANRIGPKKSGAVLKPGPVYIDANDLVQPSNGVALNAAAKVHGWVLEDYPNVGAAVTMYVDIDMSWGPSTLTPGSLLYLGTTAQELDTATTTGGTVACAQVVENVTMQGTPHSIIRVLTVR